MVAIVAGLAGATWLLSPAGTLERARAKRADLSPTRPPNAVGRAMGYRAVWKDNPRTVDPLDVLVGRASVRTTAQQRLVYQPHRGFAEYVRAPGHNYRPLPTQDLRGLALQASLRQSPRTNPGVAITAADVLGDQLGQKGSGSR